MISCLLDVFSGRLARDVDLREGSFPSDERLLNRHALRPASCCGGTTLPQPSRRPAQLGLALPVARRFILENGLDLKLHGSEVTAALAMM